ncbi:hypothetical protein [Vagococcus fluvialis]|uniref:hypothetical protein n=1 Tax=Vagococcus fluvialis TaxID=2738 RepID=UPI001D0B633B|nr:hypothetical protein [Vagococcus fluvialis]UDM72625.1 hypothetical protein K5L00_14655 [Vagococcus fluvialis]UDM78348.1 hypothetical protein K5K98_14860 [Vagococcus fluvialis]UDM83900.1 hypothetical protein K5K96_14680 [Vagococcus fluvialis]
MKKILIVNKSIIEDLRKKFILSEIDETFNRATYKSPNGFIERNVSLVEFEEYRSPSSFSFPTSDLSMYEKISEDILDYKKFMDSFDLEDFDVVIKKTMEGI